MKTRKITHVAFNLDTLEVLQTTSGNALKRWVARISKREGGRWIFAHGKKALKKACRKAVAIRKAELAL